MSLYSSVVMTFLTGAGTWDEEEGGSIVGIFQINKRPATHSECQEKRIGYSYPLS